MIKHNNSIEEIGKQVSKLINDSEGFLEAAHKTIKNESDFAMGLPTLSVEDFNKIMDEENKDFGLRDDDGNSVVLRRYNDDIYVTYNDGNNLLLVNSNSAYELGKKLIELSGIKDN